jgi:flagellar basal-body rod protein FlgB
MTNSIGGLLNFADRLQLASLNLRQERNNVLTANIANAETPGYRALGYDFESQLQDAAGTNEAMGLSTSDPRHMRNSFTDANGDIAPEVFVRPTESVPQDGNTVDMDREMAEMAHNQILYRSAVELINRKIGNIRYAINGGR